MASCGPSAYHPVCRKKTKRKNERVNIMTKSNASVAIYKSHVEAET